MDRGAWQVTVHGVASSQTWLRQLSIRLSIQSRANPGANQYAFVVLCSVHPPCPASRLKVDWVWQMENQQQSWDWLPNGTEEAVIWWVVALNWKCRTSMHKWRQWMVTLWGKSAIFHYWRNHLEGLEKGKDSYWVRYCFLDHDLTCRRVFSIDVCPSWTCF